MSLAISCITIWWGDNVDWVHSAFILFWFPFEALARAYRGATAVRRWDKKHARNCLPRRPPFLALRNFMHAGVGGGKDGFSSKLLLTNVPVGVNWRLGGLRSFAAFICSLVSSNILFRYPREQDAGVRCFGIVRALVEFSRHLPAHGPRAYVGDVDRSCIVNHIGR